MKKKYLVSGMTLLTMLLAVGCSNNSAKSTDSSETTSSQTSHKKHHEDRDEDTKTNDENEDSESSSSEASENSASSQSNESGNNSSSTANNAASQSQTNNKQNSQANQSTGEANFKTIIYDLIRRDGYPAGTGLSDFEIQGEATGTQIVREKKTGAAVGDYVIKNGHIYYMDIAKNQEILVK